VRDCHLRHRQGAGALIYGFVGEGEGGRVWRTLLLFSRSGSGLAYTQDIAISNNLTLTLHLDLESSIIYLLYLLYIYIRYGRTREHYKLYI